MKSQRPSRHEPRPVSPTLKYGQTGDTWGNLRGAEGALDIDDRFFFEEDPARRVFQVTRAFADPLEPQRRLFFYEAIQRDPWPDAPA